MQVGRGAVHQLSYNILDTRVSLSFDGRSDAFPVDVLTGRIAYSTLTVWIRITN